MIKAPDVTLLYVLFAFAVSYAILKKFLFRPLAAILEEREALEKSAAEVHARSVEEMRSAIAEGEAHLAAARREALKNRESLRGEGRAHLEQELDSARQEVAVALESATAEIGAASRRSAGELPERTRALARVLAEKVLGRRVAA